MLFTEAAKLLNDSKSTNALAIRFGTGLYNLKLQKYLENKIITFVDSRFFKNKLKKTSCWMHNLFLPFVMMIINRF